jgi:hypothetical protein
MNVFKEDDKDTKQAMMNKNQKEILKERENLDYEKKLCF